MLFNKNFVLLLMVWGLVISSGCSTTAPKKVEDKKPVKTAQIASINDVEYKRLSDEAQQNYKLALGAMKNNQYSVAEQLLVPVEKEYPDFLNTLVNLGIIYFKTGRIPQAEGTFKKVVEIDENNVIAYNYLGILYRQENRFEEAKNAYEQALKIDPNYAYAHLNLGILYDIYLGDPSKALSNYQRFQELTTKEDKEVKKWIVDLQRRQNTN